MLVGFSSLHLALRTTLENHTEPFLVNLASSFLKWKQTQAIIGSRMTVPVPVLAGGGDTLPMQAARRQRRANLSPLPWQLHLLIISDSPSFVSQTHLKEKK